jgi:hypothetical protein
METNNMLATVSKVVPGTCAFALAIPLLACIAAQPSRVPEVSTISLEDAPQEVTTLDNQDGTPPPIDPNYGPIVADRILGDSWFGYGATWIEDIDLDGYRDLAVPDQIYDTGEPFEATEGVAFLLSGRDGHVIRVIKSPSGEHSFWGGMSTGPDVDGDGLSELFLFGYRADGEEQIPFVRLISAITGEAIWEQLKVPGTGLESRIGEPCDFDGDGVVDVFVWGYEPNPRFRYWGSLSALSGADGHVLFEASGTREYRIGVMDACTISDFDGDGIADLAMGVYRQGLEPVEGYYCLEIRSGATGQLLFEYPGIEHQYGLGFTLDALDLTGDSVKELFVGGQTLRDEDSLGNQYYEI